MGYSSLVCVSTFTLTKTSFAPVLGGDVQRIKVCGVSMLHPGRSSLLNKTVILARESPKLVPSIKNSVPTSSGPLFGVSE